MTHGNISLEHKVDQISCKLVTSNNMYMVGQRMNMYFVDFISIHEWLSLATNVVGDSSNTTKRNLVANVVYN
jgi:hypothetical protein